MTKVTLSIPQLALIAATRAMAAAGAALLLADRLDRDQRRAVGRTLVAVGAIATLPLAAEVIAAARKQRATARDQETARAAHASDESRGRQSAFATSP